MGVAVLGFARSRLPCALALALFTLAAPTATWAATVPSATTTYAPAGSSPQPSTTPGAPGTSALPNPSTSVPGQAALPVRTSAGQRGRHLSAGAIVIAALAALLALACLAWALARRRAYEPRWWLSLRHAVAEAGFRASAMWAEFADWLRLGH